MQLAGTCRAWHQVIIGNPLHQLSEEAHQAVLPLGLTSSLPLLQLVKQQAQLLAWLRGKHGFAAHIQCLSFSHHLLDVSQQGNAQPSNPAPQLQLDGILWSPCTRVEEPSRWLTLQLSLQRKQLPIVVDSETGRQVCIPEDSSAMLLALGDSPWNHAAWLTDKSDRMLFFRGSGSSHGPIACLTDAHGQGGRPLVLPGTQRAGTCWFFTGCSKEGSAVDMLCWTQASNHQGERSEGPISVFNASSTLLLYHLRCPDQLHQRFLELQTEGNSHYKPASEDLHWFSPTAHRVLLAPNKQLLAVFWRCHVPLLVIPCGACQPRGFEHSLSHQRRSCAQQNAQWRDKVFPATVS